MEITRNIILGILTFFVLSIQASVRIGNHTQLQDALRDNQPPSGYIDLSQCKTEVVVGELPEDKQVYRLSFKDNFSFNMTSKIITSVFDTVLNNSQIVKTVPVLVKVPATVFVTSSAKADYLRYQITVAGQETLIRIYHCPWDRAVYLWQ
ncbi:hypothetical protein [Candidatus Sororendozoicomonas aggregata]|uniref:hypothetical protein n=1 Tax=Candidatus Sororendozoicomonas aggregata TaxID=3073239 RepID=UPI002ED52E6F